MFDIEFACVKVGGDGRFLVVGVWRLVSSCFASVGGFVGISHCVTRIRDPVCVLFGVVSSPDGFVIRVIRYSDRGMRVILGWRVVVAKSHLAVSTSFPRGNHG